MFVSYAVFMYDLERCSYLILRVGDTSVFDKTSKLSKRNCVAIKIVKPVHDPCEENQSILASQQEIIECELLQTKEASAGH